MGTRSSTVRSPSASRWRNTNELSKAYNLTKQVIANFFGRLGINPGPEAEWGPKLEEFAAEFHENKARVAAIDNPRLAALAKEALERGDLKRTEMLVAVARDQVQAVRLLGDQPEQALQKLQISEQVVNELLKESPSDIRLKLQQGYVYKTYAQAFAELKDGEKASQYLDQAFDIFEQIRQTSPDKETVRERAEAANGLGNMYHQRGEYRKAIRSYELATELLPSYAYAWHDMFAAYLELAKQGDVNFDAMQNSLDKVKQTGLGWPGLDADYIAQLDDALSAFNKK